MLHEFRGHIRTDDQAGSGCISCPIEPAVQSAIKFARQAGIIIGGGSCAQQAPQPG